MKKIFTLLMSLFGINAARSTPPDSTLLFLTRYQPEIDAYQKADMRRILPDQPVVFAGSSSIRLWGTLAQDMKGLPVLNRGFGGSTFPELIYYSDLLIMKYKPSAVFLYEGDNDLTNPSVTPELVLDGLQQYDTLMTEQMPGVPTYVLSIKPSPSRAELMPRAIAANALMAAYIATRPNLYFIDITTPLLNEQGEARKELYSEDMLHMNAEGYKIWAAILYPYVAAAYMQSPACK